MIPYNATATDSVDEDKKEKKIKLNSKTTHERKSPTRKSLHTILITNEIYQ